MLQSILILTALLLCLLVAQGEPMLFDFEKPEEIGAWTIRSAGQDTLVQSEQYATSGDHSMVFATPAWKEGLEQWPAFEAKPPVSDWTGYDRLVIDVTNPNEGRFYFCLLASDSKVPFRSGLAHRIEIPSKGFGRSVVPLGDFPQGVDRKDISILHFFSQRPDSDVTLYLDNLRLLAPGEPLPALPTRYVRELAGLSLGGVTALDALVEDCRKAMYAEAETDQDRQLADVELAKVAAQVQSIRDRLQAPDMDMNGLNAVRATMDAVSHSPERVRSVFRLRRDFAKLGFAASPVMVGFATSMVKLLPKDMPFDLSVSRSAEVSLARNEKEALQVAVMPRQGAVTGVSVSVGDLTSETGAKFSADNIDCDVMGYVETKARPPYDVSYVGWWPDPILDFLEPIDIAEGDLQSFWVRVRAPKDQPAGIYRGTLTVSAQGAEPLKFDLTVRVRNFTLPDCTPLPTAISFFEAPHQMGGVENWQQMKIRYADFLADYYIDYDSLYRQGAPDWDVIQHLHDTGRLVAFNLGNVLNGGIEADKLDAAIKETVDRIRPAYEEAKRRGLLDHAYIYGFDERPPEQFPMLEKSAQALRAAFPEVLLMTTSYDHSFGLNSEVKTIDAWCPLTPSFLPDLAADARAAGKKVWWYICCGPHNPFANWFVEYAAIESRQLMGPMTIKLRPDGFLYYALTIWNNNQPIESGPFTEWNPVSWTVYHGDGSLFCSGPGGKPVPTIRLENYRDGMEDFAYACILEEIIRRHEAKGGALTGTEKVWLEEARAALAVPEALVENMARYSHDPQELYAYRNRLAEMIDRSGVTDADPWGDDFGVRGFKTN